MREKERERERKRAKERERVREINHLSVHQWIRSAIRESQQPTSPIGFPIFETSATALCGTTGTM